MRKYCLFFILSLSLSLFGEPVQAYLDYINQYKAIALDEQSKYGIPASITLAQGILESAAGKSELAINAVLCKSRCTAVQRDMCGQVCL